MPELVQEIIIDALGEIGVLSTGEPLAAAEADIALRYLNRMIDQWAARMINAYNVSFTAYTLTPNHQPHLIGPGLVAPDFAMAQRPVRIENAALILNNLAQPVDIPLNIRDDDWWANQRVKSIATSVPTDLYYSPDWPNGALWLWPIPTFPYGLRLETWGLISGFTSIADTVELPPGYREGVMLTLAEKLARPFGRTVSQDLRDDAARARAIFQTNNAKSPRCSSADYGTRGKQNRPTFNYYSGT